MKQSASRKFLTIFNKEVVDNLRDKRTLTTLAISVIIGPLIMFGFLWFAEKSVKEELDLVNAEPLELPVVGADHAPNLVNFLKQNNIKPITEIYKPEQRVRDGEFKMVLLIPANYPQRFRQGLSAPVRLIHDGSISGLARVGINRVQLLLQQYSSQIGQLRMRARGISPQILQPLTVNLSDVAAPEARNSEILTMLPYLIVIFIMVGGMYLAIDTTAGEREKGSLEPLLTQPVSRATIVLAKLTATCLFSALTLLMVLIGLGLAFRYVSIDAITVSISVNKIILVFAVCLPFVFLGSALMILLASFTKSYKEAQSYLGIVMLVPSLPLILLGLLSPTPDASNMWVPSLSQGLFIIETLKGESVDAYLVLLSAASSSVLAILLTLVAITLYQKERILG